ncbi:MAG: aminotransferase class I/II-fold pyridoxal phosphate-dependent enzyme [Bacteroidales bacterium]|jgi:aromatic-L-amino-acid decarboxylase|nr:aminotransferase class I/II-fold pyridoxal phosphate-dependent enzyme [Bacteroidales bacterium]
MTPSEFRKYAHDLVDWLAWYLENIESFPVKSRVRPGEVYAGLPEQPPMKAEDFDTIFRDFNEIIMPGMTHWQSPNFFAYFPANTSPPSILAEMITATLGAQCMIWETSPAAAELEERVVNWLRDQMGLPAFFEGVIQDTASTSVLASIITARERITRFDSNEEGLSGCPKLRVYGSTQTHSSVEKGVKIAGLGRKNFIRVRTRNDYSLDPRALEKAINDDLAAGCTPCCVVATIGTTGTTAIDPVREIGEICRRYGVWLHVDGALGGTALLLPEFGHLLQGFEFVDSFVFNPHKWMFTNFDCSVYWVRDAAHLIKTFEILPEYLKTRTRGSVNDYRDWGIPLGRRFRALKLWMVIRSFGIEGLRNRIRDHIGYARKLAVMIEDEPDFELVVRPVLNTVCFRYSPPGIDVKTLNAINESLNHRLNDSGKIYLTHTSLEGRYTLRMVVSQTNVTEEHVMAAWDLIKSEARAAAK